jgi:predicted GIY-YIG superfamily endonuclease
MFYIYLIKNLINGKVYIGETGSPKRRFKDHINIASLKGHWAKIKLIITTY